MEPRVTLITLGVIDLERSVRFYRDGLGFPTQYKAGAPVAFFSTGVAASPGSAIRPGGEFEFLQDCSHRD